ncbi:PASTA domain-containing protein [Caldicoprobacter faecalis]|uniref:PASTA domain-containing protein n=1 Tax=Caldicoprobacter faecalis TaxID=937334 RepID=A0A1I5RPI2_9FIRM|nr:PASTA domain-containing protein [Caldicoprobacter faecalis]SFP60464.1 PASTA domain-containing protein [Caldicoprobacter faecalis]
MGVPDLVGLNLQDALQILEESGLCATPRIVRYFPPASKGLEQGCNVEERVIRQRIVENGQIELVVSSFKDCPRDF